MIEEEPRDDLALEWALALAEHVATLDAPQDTAPRPSLADLFNPDPVGALARRIRGLIAMSELFKNDRVGAAELRKAIDLLLVLLSADGGITLTHRDVAMFEVGRATGRWEAQEEAGGGIVARRITKAKLGANARSSTAKDQANTTAVDKAIGRLLPTMAANTTKSALVAGLHELLKQEGFVRGISKERLGKLSVVRKAVGNALTVNRSVH